MNYIFILIAMLCGYGAVSDILQPELIVPV